MAAATAVEKEPMVYTKACEVSQVPPGAVRVFDLGRRSVVVCNVGGDFYAVDDLCTHDEGPLGRGKLRGHEIECPRHKARFDVRTGEATALPAVLGVEAFPTRVRGDDVEVDIGS